MISLDAAKLIVEREINREFTAGDRNENKLMVYPELTMERNWGWVIFCGSEENYYLDPTQDHRQHLSKSGSSAFLVNRVSSELMQAGKSWPVEKYIEDYETHLGSIQT